MSSKIQKKRKSKLSPSTLARKNAKTAHRNRVGMVRKKIRCADGVTRTFWVKKKKK